MEHTDLIADFAERTLQNLEHIEEQEGLGNERVFFVTQLWNSLLGLIVLPHERDVSRIPGTLMTELVSQGWPQIITEQGRPNKSLRDLVRRLRIAVAHFNIEFIVGSDREITAVRMWNQQLGSDGKPIRGTRGWQGRIEVEELNELARRIGRVYVVEFRSTAA